MEEYWQFRTDWETVFDEDHQYLMLMPELVYSQVWEHCTRAFPSKLVSFKGPRRVVAVELKVRPVAITDVVYRLWVQMHELDGIRAENRALHRTMDMVVHNTAVLTKALVANCIPKHLVVGLRPSRNFKS